MNIEYDGQNAFTAAANGDFPLVVLLWGMAMAVQPAPVDMLAAADANGNTIMHHAASVALEGNTSIVHFLIQQTQAAGRDVATVVDARNVAGETPLIRAAHVGNIRVVETLVQYGRADLTARDKAGNTAAHHAAAKGHLWALHFLLEAAARAPAPSAEAKDATVVEGDGHSKHKTTALHYAAAGEHKVVVQYLMTRNFDANAPDDNGTSALDLARSPKLVWLATLLKTSDRSFSQAPTKCRSTRLWLVLLYGLLLFAVLATSYWLPWYIAVPFIVVVLVKSLGKFRQPHGHGHSHGGGDVESTHPSKRSMKVPASVTLDAISGPMPTTVPTVVSSLSGSGSPFKKQPEMIVGVWMGWVMLFTFFHAVVWVDPAYAFVVGDYEPFLIALWVAEGIFLAVWVRLAVICPSDPGVVTTFQQDVTDMLAKAAQGIPPPQASHCRTCYIRKPVRSKHCAQCGVCVARMDHHCAWINRCVGFGNHRLFMVFLVIHNLVLIGYVALASIVFQRLLQPSNLEASRGSASLRVWMQIPSLIGDHFLAFLVLLWAALAFAALLMMLVQHIGMMEKNLTINEQINWKRYPYLKQKGPGGTDKPQLENQFDRGLLTNVAEFWRRSGPSYVDYRAVFELPEAAQPLKTQDMV